MKKTSSQFIALFSLVVCAVAIFSVGSFVVKAQTSSNALTGYAWSSTIGWINVDSHGFGDGVFLATSTGNPTVGTLSGYAWSPNIGWVSFNPSDVAGCPGGNCQATVDLTSGAVGGWAKATAGDTSWDGWISLSGDSYLSPTTDGTGGITFDTTSGIFSGYAWGSTNVGWLSFHPSNSVYVSCPSCVGVQPLTGLSCTASNTNLPAAGSVTFTVSASGGNGTSPYNYSWGSVNTKTIPYTAGSYSGPIVTVTDSSAPIKTGQVVCPNIVVAGAVASCTAPAHATACDSTGPGPATIQSSCTGVVAPACIYRCSTGYSLKNGQCSKSSLQEL